MGKNKRLKSGGCVPAFVPLGSVTEVLYGICKELKQLALPKLRKQFVKIINKFYNKINNISYAN